MARGYQTYSVAYQHTSILDTAETYYSGPPLFQTPMGHDQVSRLTGCPHFQGWICITLYCIVHTLGHHRVSRLMGCPHFRGGFILHRDILSVLGTGVCSFQGVGLEGFHCVNTENKESNPSQCAIHNNVVCLVYKIYYSPCTDSLGLSACTYSSDQPGRHGHAQSAQYCYLALHIV